MKRSITAQMFVILFASLLILLLTIGISIKVGLPDYYKNKVIGEIEYYEEDLRQAYLNQNIDEISRILMKIRTDLNGNLVIVNTNGTVLSAEKGQGKGNGKNQTKYEIPSDATSDFGYSYKNPNGVEFYLYGLKVEDIWVLYQIPMSSIKKVTGIVSDFYTATLWISFGLALFISFFLSRLITKPILKLNRQTEQMKALQIEVPQMSERPDEIGMLTNSVNLMYKELVGNITKLEEALIKEKSLDKLRKQFVYRVSHELQTPFAVIQAYSEALADGFYSSDEEMQNYLQVIRDESNNMSKLIKDTLDISKLESGEFEISKEHFEIEPWLDNITTKFKGIIEKKDLEMTCIKKYQSKYILGDPFRLEQALKNLIINAIEHSDKTIEVTCEEFDKSFSISVYNSGNPIKEQEIPWLFQSFYKAKGKKKGTGLGLAIVRNIIELHEGHYEVENCDSGVRFIMAIPTGH